MEIQKHLQDLEQFRTTIDDIELLCLIKYYPEEGDDINEPHYEEACELRNVLLDGRDVYVLLSGYLIKLIEKRFMEKVKEERDARTLMEKRMQRKSNARTEIDIWKCV